MRELDEAIELALSVFPRLSSERIALADALGRRLSDALTARQPVPEFRTSAMDGFAVRAADVAEASAAKPTPVRIVGTSRAGLAFDGELTAGCAVRIATGAPVPAGADAVVAVEDTHETGDEVRVGFAPRVGHHIRPVGSEIAVGDALLGSGAAVCPGAIAALASQGYATLTVHRRPVVAIVSTGDELREIGDPPRAASLVATNAWMLAAQVRRAGGEPRVLASAKDEPEELDRALREASTADVVLTTGGASVGDRDGVAHALARAGVTLVFDKVRMKPGKPAKVGRRGDTPFVALPGNPGAAFVAFELFVAPGLRRMQGSAVPFPPPHERRLAHPHRHGLGRAELARVRFVGDGTMSLASQQGSASLPSLVSVDGLALLPADAAAFEAGEPLRVWRLDVDGTSRRHPFAGDGEAACHSPADE